MTLASHIPTHSGPMFRQCVDPDYLGRVGECGADFGKTLFGDLGKTG